MNIPAVSSAMAQGQIQAQFATALASEVMDMAEVSSQNMLKMLETTNMEHSVNPHLGNNIDVML